MSASYIIFVINNNNFNELSKLLKNPDTDLNDRNSNGFTPLADVAYENNYIGIKMLCDAGADIDIVDNDGRTPLMLAVLKNIFHDDYRCIHILVEKYSANLEIKDSSGKTAALHAAECGNEDILIYLLDKGANPNISDKEGVTLIMHAYNSGIYKILMGDKYKISQDDKNEVRMKKSIV